MNIVRPVETCLTVINSRHWYWNTWCIFALDRRAHCYTFCIFHSLLMQFEHFLGLGGESPYWTFTICTMHSSQLAVWALWWLHNRQSFPIMCNCTSCSQVQELPQSNYGDNRENIVIHFVYFAHCSWSLSTLLNDSLSWKRKPTTFGRPLTDTFHMSP